MLPCNKCKRKFPSPSKLVIHKRKHTFPQSNPTKVLAKFKCTDKIHMKIHSNEFREPPICIFLHDSLEIFSYSCKVVLTRFKKKIKKKHAKHSIKMVYCKLISGKMSI